MFPISRVLLVGLFVAAGWAQAARTGGSGERMLVVVPMVGAGTWEDPRRPALVREAGVAFRYQVSDDGQTAIVEVSPRGPLDWKRVEESIRKEPRAKVFRPSKDKQDDVVFELKQLKKDFSIDSFGKGPEAVVPR